MSLGKQKRGKLKLFMKEFECEKYDSNSWKNAPFFFLHFLIETKNGNGNTKVCQTREKRISKNDPLLLHHGTLFVESIVKLNRKERPNFDAVIS